MFTLRNTIFRGFHFRDFAGTREGNEKVAKMLPHIGYPSKFLHFESTLGNL
jgi:hypothetical protein